ncbi:MAG: F0F1 ATP synthase subunit A [Phycisphaerales bacterium]|nr:F0F1 ATP synthase subunit A [Planctomycetota bacterium]MCH8509089.1 F0F1 ATP synthase subunit A [Phycisphaerales bacterium]
MLSSSLMLAAANPADHVYNHPFWVTEGGLWLWSAQQGTLVLSLIIIVIVGLWFAKQVQTGPASDGSAAYTTKNPFAHMLEVICVYLREEIARPLLGDRTNKLMPFLWTIFWFVLVNNMLGMVPLLDLMHLLNSDWKKAHIAPIGGTATQNIAVTGVLAVIAMIFFNLIAIRHLGIGGFLKHMTAGAPFPASIAVFALEILGQFVIKPFALAVRLAANMTGGHVLLAVVLFFSGMVVNQGFFVRAPVTLISVVGGFAVFLLEVFVAFMQAFIFMFLVTVFIALMDHDHDHEHDHEHEHHDEHERAPDADPVAVPIPNPA